MSYNKNPGAFSPNFPAQQEIHNNGHKRVNVNQVNARFNLTFSRQDTLEVGPIVRRENTLVDIEKNEVIARYVGFSSGNSVKNPSSETRRYLKFWIYASDCIGGSERQIKFGEFSHQFRGVEK